MHVGVGCLLIVLPSMLLTSSATSLDYIIRKLVD